MPPFTKNAIKKSFVELLNQYPLSKITVKKIVEACGVNRNSFYYHYQDIPMLLEEVIQDEIEAMKKELRPEFTLEQRALVVLEDLTRKKKIVMHIWDSVGRESYEQYLMKLCEYLTYTYMDGLEEWPKIPKDVQELMVNFLKCEFFGQIIDWLNQGASFDLVEHGGKICRILNEYMERRIQSQQSGRQT